MSSASQEITLWSAELAARLRLLQASFADEPSEMRERVLAEEIDRALAAVPITRREECLEQIAAEFPLLQGAPPAAPPPAPSSEILDDPGALLERLLAFLPHLSEQDVAALTARLAETLLLPAPPADARVPIPEELQKRLDKLVPGRRARIDQARALRMLDLLLDLTSALDQLVWQVWKTVAPKSVIRPESGRFGDFRKCLVPFLTGDPEVSTEQVKQIVGHTRKLVSGLLAAMGTVGETYGAKISEQFAPSAIKRAAEAEVGFLGGLEKKCWSKYVQLATELHGPTIEKEVREIIKRYTEQFVLGKDAAGDLAEED